MQWHRKILCKSFKYLSPVRLQKKKALFLWGIALNHRKSQIFKCICLNAEISAHSCIKNIVRNFCTFSEWTDTEKGSRPGANTASLSALAGAAVLLLKNQIVQIHIGIIILITHSISSFLISLIYYMTPGIKILLKFLDRMQIFR